MYEQNETLKQALRRNVDDALFEDVGRGDWTAQLVPAGQTVNAVVQAKESAVVCGVEWFDAAIHAMDAKARIDWLVEEGDVIAPGSLACKIRGDARALLSAERTALNFLQMLSAVATQTRAYAEAIAGVSPNPKGCVVLDTRKTLPGLRQAQKHAVRVGGGTNHRMALWDGILIKENHIAAAGGIAAALRTAQQLDSGVSIQIEVENLDELAQALECGATSVLLDDFTLEDMHRAFELNAGRALLEVSGGVDLQSIQAIAATGVDRISTGKLTKDVRAIDFSMRIVAP